MPLLSSMSIMMFISQNLVKVFSSSLLELSSLMSKTETL